MKTIINEVNNVSEEKGSARMRKYLLPKDGSFYKANLHCHSTFSDGKKTPSELKKMYMDEGYSVVAFSDHNIFVCHNDELTDENFVALNATEINLCETDENGTVLPFLDKKSVHLGLIAKDPDNRKHPLYHRTKYGPNDRVKDIVNQEFYEEDEDFERSFTTECVNAAIKKAKDRGFFVIYNHPTWSLNGYEHYSTYEGMDAMEMFNYHNYVVGYPEYNPRVYDDLLRQNKRIFCVSADDNHNGQNPQSRKFDSGWAWTMIKADSLDYSSVTRALVDGQFYASEGPEIYELTFEDGRIHIECSNADRIVCNYGVRHAELAIDEVGDGIKSADFGMNPDWKYFRITVIGKDGKTACTNAYFADELFTE